MRLLAAFVSHEARTQLRSTRYRVLASVYAAAAAIPAVALYLASKNLGIVLGSGAYADVLRALVPALTALFATVMAVDAITRERDEGSFGVVSLAPVSATGYVLCRWVAVLVLSLPLTIVPYAIAAGLAGHGERRMPALEPLAWDWLLHAVPPLVVMSALMLSLGTITGRTILAILAWGGAMTFGLGLLQDLMALWHRHLEGPGSLMGFDPLVLMRLVWTVRGWWQFDSPTAAGYPIELEADRVVPESALIVAGTLVLLGISPAFLRRTRQDVRPRTIRPDHPLRTMLRGFNRIREEYRPDAGLQPFDRVVMLSAAIAAIVVMIVLVRRDTTFTRLAHERYAAEEAREPREMSAMLAPHAIRVEGSAGRAIRTRTTFAIVNRGAKPDGHLAFSLNPSLAVEEVTTTCGRTRVTRIWERVGIDLERPLAPGASCTVTVDVAGSADVPVFNLAGKGNFGARYRMWRDATKSIDLSDLSRSTWLRGVTRARLSLWSSDFAPVPRYSPWRVSDVPVDAERDVSSFTPDRLLSPADVRVSLRVPEGMTVVDSCGTTATKRLDSGCSFAFTDFRIAGARFTRMPLGGATLVHLPPHDELARIHAPALAEAVSIAERAWPGLALRRSPVFVERPIDGDGQRVSWRNPQVTVIEASGPVFFIPEWMFIQRKPLAAPQIAASMISSTLRSRRPVPAAQRRFFDRFLAEVARGRTGTGEAREATIGPRGPRPSTEPLLTLGWGQFENARLRGSIADLEYRVGAERLVEAVNEFASAPGIGNAKELFDTLSRRSGVDLQAFYRDYVVGNALPKLTLENAKFERDGNRWTVRVTARNLANGEVVCPVVLRTKFGSVRQTVRIGEGESVPVTLTSDYEPRTLQLDPDHVVYRHAAVGTVDSIDFEGAS